MSSTYILIDNETGETIIETNDWFELEKELNLEVDARLMIDDRPGDYQLKVFPY